MDSRKDRSVLLLISFLVLNVTAVGLAAEKEYPNRQIEMIINFAPGGPTDVAARIIHPSLQAILGVPIVLTNKAGAGGAMGAEFVLNAKPDGYTILAHTNATMAIVPNLNPAVKYRHTDFQHVCAYAIDPVLIASKPNAPWKTVEELLDYVKKNPGKLNYGSPGMGTAPFFSMEVFKLAFGLDIAPVHFQGTGPVKIAILGGHVDLAASGFGAMVPLIKAGSIPPLLISTEKRLPEFPNIPTMAEKGIREASINVITQLSVSKKCPKIVADKLAQAMEEVMKDPNTASQLEKAGLSIFYRGSAETLNLIEEESKLIVRMAQILGMVGK